MQRSSLVAIEQHGSVTAPLIPAAREPEFARYHGAGATTSAGPEPTSNEGTGGLLGGLGGLLDKLRKSGLGNVTNSWVGSGQNQPVSPGQLGPALGSDLIKALAQRSGLSEEELTKQLSQVLPGVVDKLTPAGRLPTLAKLSK